MAEALIVVRGPRGYKFNYKVFASGNEDPDIYRAWLAERFEKYSPSPAEVVEAHDCKNSHAALNVYHNKLAQHYRDIHVDDINVQKIWSTIGAPILRKFIKEAIAEAN